MPDLEPANPGDLVYPKYAVVTTMPIGTGLQIVKGVVYSPGGAGNLEPVATTLAAGIFQATVTPDGVSGGAGEDSVQVLGPRTRMLFTTQVGLRVGEDVIVVANTTNVIAGAKSSDLYIGKIFEIYTPNADGSQKIITSGGDKVIVETVQA